MKEITAISHDILQQLFQRQQCTYPEDRAQNIYNLFPLSKLMRFSDIFCTIWELSACV